MSRRFSTRYIYSFTALLSFVAIASVPACGQVPVLVPLRSMERPRDVDFICLQYINNSTWRGVPISRCHIGDSAESMPLNKDGLSDPQLAGDYRLHAVLTQQIRGELAVVDLGHNPTEAPSLLKVDPRVPGYTFLPTGAVPTDVTTDPAGRAVYVASGHERRVDIIPSEMIRGPLPSSSDNEQLITWPHLDFDPIEDGAPTQLSIVRPNHTDSTKGRLYVLLPEAKNGAKIAVFDIGAASFIPPRLGDIRLRLNNATALPPTNSTCAAITDTDQGAPWWKPYDACFPGQVDPPTTTTTPTTTPTVHLSHMMVIGTTLYAANDSAPFLHIFDLSSGIFGEEIQRISTGAPIARIAVSEPLVDEVTVKNAPAIMKCEEMGWVGDGLDHSVSGPLPQEQQSGLVGSLLGGKCRAHRYVYAIDLKSDGQTEANTGTIAVVDVPVFFKTDPTTHNILRNTDGSVVEERIDFASATMAQPNACSTPMLKSSRISAGSFGILGSQNVPVRAIDFIHFNPPALITNTNGLDDKTFATATSKARCRPWDRGTHPDSTIDALIKREPILNPTFFDAKSTSEEYWRSGVDPRRLRGTFALAALANGNIGVINVDDYDSLCRGPRDINDALPADSALTRNGKAVEELGLGLGATGEFSSQANRRHQVRGQSFLSRDLAPSILSISLVSGQNSLSFDSTPEGSRRPHLLPLRSALSETDPNRFVVPSPDNVYAIANEVWSVVYQGALPGLTNRLGTFEFKNDGIILHDAAANFCSYGVEAEADSPIEAHDIVQIVDDVCEVTQKTGDRGCSQQTHDQCLKTYGDIFDGTILPPTRDLVIDRAYQDRLEIKQTFLFNESKNVYELGPIPASFRECFPGPTKYAIRTRNSWLVIGSTSGYLHRRKPVDPQNISSACTIDKTKPIVLNGRVCELPMQLQNGVCVCPSNRVVVNGQCQCPQGQRLSNGECIASSAQTPPVNFCKTFVNPSWSWAIESGNEPSVRDMIFSIRPRSNFSPLYLFLSNNNLLTTVRPVSFVERGIDKLNWNQFALVDSIDRGLVLYSISDLSKFNSVY